jgi:hypothetical protein
MNQTGVCGTSWPRHARRKVESFNTEVTGTSCHAFGPVLGGGRGGRMAPFGVPIDD